ncbi:MAG TPA: sulfur oxidation c-type cytochrome SoxX [Devosia sp.]|nr:sulfur oxidation c-type cytochrome SoxX [Devosia sp.]
MVRQHHRGNVRLIALAAGLALLAGHAAAAGPPGLDKPLTGKPGDPANGLKLVLDANKGDCTACHSFPVPGMPPDAFGDLAPPLAGVGKLLSVAQLRQRIVDPQVVTPGTIMPSYFSTSGLYRVDPKYAGKTILSAQEVEDVVSYLATLK